MLAFRCPRDSRPTAAGCETTANMPQPAASSRDRKRPARKNQRMRQFWRARLPRPRHGFARGVAVWGSPGFRHDGEQLADVLADCRNLRAWARARGVDLDDHPDSLARLDRALEPSTEDDRRILEMDGGLYLGTTMVGHLPGARWHIWSNGHPVVKLDSGRYLDVVAIVNNLADAGESHLAALYTDAAAD